MSSYNIIDPGVGSPERRAATGGTVIPGRKLARWLSSRDGKTEVPDPSISASSVTGRPDPVPDHADPVVKPVPAGGDYRQGIQGYEKSPGGENVVNMAGTRAGIHRIISTGKPEEVKRVLGWLEETRGSRSLEDPLTAEETAEAERRAMIRDQRQKEIEEELAHRASQKRLISNEFPLGDDHLHVYVITSNALSDSDPAGPEEVIDLADRRRTRGDRKRRRAAVNAAAATRQEQSADLTGKTSATKNGGAPDREAARPAGQHVDREMTGIAPTDILEREPEILSQIRRILEDERIEELGVYWYHKFEQ